MTDDRSLERAARSWLEDGPTEAPDHAVEAALLTIQSTTQERDWLPWRTRPMTQTLRLLAGAAAVAALVVVGGALILRPGAGSSVGGQSSAAPSVSAPPASAPTGASPSASASPIACALLSNEEAATAAEFPDVGARPSVAAGGDGTMCTWFMGGVGGNVIMDITYTKPGGQVAFQAAKRASGVQVLSGIGTDAIFDPATGTLSLAKGDVMVTIATRSPSPSPPAAIVAIAKLIAGRM